MQSNAELLRWFFLSALTSVAVTLLFGYDPAIASPPLSEQSLLADEVGQRVYTWGKEGPSSGFVPTGLMPDGEGIVQNAAVEDDPHSKPHCIRLGCQLSIKAWVGIYFLLEGQWEPENIFDLFEELGAKKGDPIKCRFWARSKDQATVQFKVGGIRKGKVSDSLRFPVTTRWIKLTPKWTMYEIDLTNKDLSSLVGGFAWVCDQAHNRAKDVTFDLDTIYFVRTKPESN